MLVPSPSSTAPTADPSASASRHFTRKRMRRLCHVNCLLLIIRQLPLLSILPCKPIKHPSVSSSSTSNSSTSQRSSSPDQYFCPYQLLALDHSSQNIGKTLCSPNRATFVKNLIPIWLFSNLDAVGGAKMKKERKYSVNDADPGELTNELRSLIKDLTLTEKLLVARCCPFIRV